MSSQFGWARSLFKGRIAEAIVESVLSEFGYRVYRSGQEEHRLPGQGKSTRQRIFAPDLAVTDPKSHITKYIEVKFRSARPMSVILEASRLDNIRRYYPGTILVFVSSYNGSVNCAGVDEMPPDTYRVRADGFCEFDLVRDGWKPLWHYFPLVQPGDRLKRLWEGLISDLHSFAESRISRREELESFSGEREELEAYIEKNWHPDMKLYSEGYSNLKALSLDKLWEQVREINAYRFALAICGDEDLGSDGFSYVIDRLLGRQGEKYVTIDLNQLREALEPHPDLLKRFDALRFLAGLEHDMVQKNAPRLSRMMFEFFQSLPAGIGKAYLLPEQGTLDNALEVDFRTVFALMQKRNRLDVDNQTPHS